MSWKEEAKMQYFDYGLSINEIAKMTGKSRKSVSAFLNTLNDFKPAKEKRKELNSHERAEKAREYIKERRRAANQNVVDGFLLRRDHETAVAILSKERFFNE